MLFMLGFGHCETVNIIPAAGKKPDHTGKNSRLIVNKNRKRMSFDILRLLHIQLLT